MNTALAFKDNANEIAEGGKPFFGISLSSDASKIFNSVAENSPNPPTSQLNNQTALDLADRAGIAGQGLREPIQGVKAQSTISELGGQSFKMGAELFAGIGSLFGSKEPANIPDEPELRIAAPAPVMNSFPSPGGMA